MRKILLIVSASVSLFAWNAPQKAEVQKKFVEMCTISDKGVNNRRVCDCLATNLTEQYSEAEFEVLKKSLAQNVIPTDFLKFMVKNEKECRR